MIYKNIKELPPIVQTTLPPEVQTLYLEVFNQTWEQFAAIEKDEATLATLAQQRAWDAVTSTFVEVKAAHGSGWYQQGKEPKAEPSQPQRQAILGLLGLR